MDNWYGGVNHFWNLWESNSWFWEKDTVLSNSLPCSILTSVLKLFRFIMKENEHEELEVSKISFIKYLWDLSNVFKQVT